MNVRYLSVASLLTLAAAVNAVAAPAGTDRLIALLPAETSVVFLVDDVPTFLTSWPATPLGGVWNDPEVKRFLTPMRDAMKIDDWEQSALEETGHTLSEILGVFSGPAAVAILDVKELIEADENGLEPPVLMLAEVSEDGEIVRDLLALDLEGSEEEAGEGVQIEAAEEEFRGETLNFQRTISADGEIESGFWAIVDGVAMIAGTKDLLQRTVAGLKDEVAGDSLASAGRFGSIRARFSPYDVLFYLNIGEFVPLILESIQKAEREAAEAREEAAAEDGAAPEPPPNPLGITPEAVFDAFGFDSFHDFALAYSFGERTTRIDSAITYDEGPGLARVLQSYRPGPVALPEFIPDDVVDAAVSNFSFSATWQALREAFRVMSPQADGMLNVQLAQLKTTAGIDIEGSLMSSLGERMITASFRKPSAVPGEKPALGETDTLFGIELADRQGIELVLEFLKNMAGPYGIAFEEQEFLDHTIYVSKMPVAPPAAEEGEEDSAEEPPAPPGFSYAMTQDYLFISAGTAEPIRTVLSRMRRPGRSVWARPEVESALESFSETASAISYMDFSSSIMQVFKMFAAMEKLGNSKGGEKAESFGICDPEALPDRKVLAKHLGIAVGAVFREAGGLFSTRHVHANPR